MWAPAPPCFSLGGIAGWENLLGNCGCCFGGGKKSNGLNIEFMMLSLAIFVGFKRFGIVFSVCWLRIRNMAIASVYAICVPVTVCVLCRLYASQSCQRTRTLAFCSCYARVLCECASVRVWCVCHGVMQ